MRDLTRYLCGNTRRHRAASVVALLAFSPVLPAAGAPATVTTAALADGSFVVTLSITAQLQALSSAAVKGAWSCSVKAASKRSIDADVAKISTLTGRAARDAYQSALIYPAHYLGQEATVDFSISNGEYSGTQAVTIKVAGRDLTDRNTGHVIDDPGVMVGCWLKLYDASGKGDFAYQAQPPTPAGAAPGDAILRTASAPYVLLSAAVPNG
jgi:hypothetical protein